MDYFEYVTKRIALFHCELHSHFGYFIRAAACMAFGAVLGWIMSLVAFVIYKVALFLGAKPLVLPDDEDDDIDMDLLEGYLPVDPRERQGERWLETYWEAQHQQLRTQLLRENQSTLAT